jgi:hypothetical protein
MAKVTIELELNSENAALLKQIDAMDEYFIRELQEMLEDSIAHRFPSKRRHYDLQGSLKLMLEAFVRDMEEMEEA